MPPMTPVPRQWRSIAELENDPAFLARASNEFPSLRDALAKPQQRRHVLRLMGAALAMGGLAGCYSGEPSGHLIPAVKVSPNIVPGLPNHYATAHLLNGFALGTVVTHQMGRPIKVEGNPNHPASLGATSAFAQAQVLDFYDPDRAMVIANLNGPVSRQTLLGAIVSQQAIIAAQHGAGFRILSAATTSPTLARYRQKFLAANPEARWHVWEPINRDHAVQGTIRAYGRPVDVVPKLEAADVLVGLDSDLLSAVPGWVRYARDFASRRNPTRTQAMSRVYAVEPSPTLLGSVADHRFSTGPREMHAVVAALAAGILQGNPPADVPPWVREMIVDLKAHRGRAFIHAGPSLSPEAHALVLAMNEALGGRGTMYELIEPVAVAPDEIQLELLAALTADMHAGKVSTLLIIDSNPVFTAPSVLDFPGALARVPLSFGLSKQPDETSKVVTWSVPMAHDWESWGDARAYDGTATILQPMALPLYNGMSAQEMLFRFSTLGAEPPSDMAAVQETWRGAFGSEFATKWHKSLADGVVPNTASTRADVKLADTAKNITLPSPPASALSILFRPDPTLWDGRYADNAWLQELPEPLTKLTWGNPLLVSPKLARKMQLKNGDRVNVLVGPRGMSAPVWVQPGQAPDVVLAWVGNGRTTTGGVGSDIGYNFYNLTGSGDEARLSKVEGRDELASTDHHALLFQNIAGIVNGIVKHATLDEFHQDPTFAKEPDRPEIYLRKPSAPTAWAMSVDLNACIGCNACVVACQAENNVPTVGKEQVLMEREMHWLRIDRYYEGTPDAPESFFQPMLCMHCEEAPCEVVCPPGATVHDAEGLNLQVYNRCVGTRFCSNNCPYKVRRFNFYPYSREQNRPAISYNNNVTVRSGGVMEKCTYCVQRIWSARIIAGQENISDGTIDVRTACQAACPTQAFTFGDKNNQQSEVYKRKQSPLDYELLKEQHTHPRTTYEALVRNPNPAIGKERA